MSKNERNASCFSGQGIVLGDGAGAGDVGDACGMAALSVAIEPRRIVLVSILSGEVHIVTRE